MEYPRVSVGTFQIKLLEIRLICLSLIAVMIYKLHGRLKDCFKFKERSSAATSYCMRMDEIWLRIYGLWPYQSNYTKYPCFLICCTWHTFTLAILSEGAANKTIGEVVVFVGLFVGIVLSSICLVVGVKHFLGNDLFKKLYSQVENSYNAIITDVEEVAIMDKFAKRAKFMVLTLIGATGFTIVSFFLLNYLPAIYDSDEEYEEMFSFYPKRYIIQPKLRRLQVIVHIALSLIYGVPFYLSTYSVYIHSVQHVCSLFDIVSYRLNKLPTTRVTNAPTSDNDILSELFRIVVKHQEALKGALIIDIAFGKLYYFVHIGSFTCCGLGIFMLQFTYAIGKANLMVTIVCAVIIFMQFISTVSYGGEQIIQLSNKVHTVMYNVRWDLMSTRARKILLMLLIRSTQSCTLGVGMAKVSLAHVTSIIKVSWSVAAVMMSRQKA